MNGGKRAEPAVRGLSKNPDRSSQPFLLNHLAYLHWSLAAHIPGRRFSMELCSGRSLTEPIFFDNYLYHLLNILIDISPTHLGLFFLLVLFSFLLGLVGCHLCIAPRGTFIYESFEIPIFFFFLFHCRNA